MPKHRSVKKQVSVYYVPCSFSAEPALRDRVDELAARMKVSRSHVLDAALRNFLLRDERELSNLLGDNPPLKRKAPKKQKTKAERR